MCIRTHCVSAILAQVITQNVCTPAGPNRVRQKHSFLPKPYWDQIIVFSSLAYAYTLVYKINFTPSLRFL